MALNVVRWRWLTEYVIVGCLTWPKYTLDNPQNVVFDANHTSLGYIEKDLFRAAGIQYISDRFVSSYGR